MGNRQRTVHRPLWFNVVAVLVWLWVVLVGAVSWWSGFAETGCGSDRACLDRARTGWAVLMVLQIVWALGVAVAMRGPRSRGWALVAGATLPPTTLVAVNAVAYPPGSFL